MLAVLLASDDPRTSWSFHTLSPPLSLPPRLPDYTESLDAAEHPVATAVVYRHFFTNLNISHSDGANTRNNTPLVLFFVVDFC